MRLAVLLACALAACVQPPSRNAITIVGDDSERDSLPDSIAVPDDPPELIVLEDEIDMGDDCPLPLAAACYCDTQECIDEVSRNVWGTGVCVLYSCPQGLREYCPDPVDS